ncbi:MAG: hypothetical protein WC121_12065 [Candidatus Kapaibacterium sp.]
MKITLIIILSVILTTLASADTYNGKIVFKADVVLDANDIEILNDNLIYKSSWKSDMDTVKLEQVDYLIVYNRSYIIEGFALGLGLGGAIYFAVGEKEDVISYLLVPTFVLTLAGAALIDYKKIAISDRISTSFLHGVSQIPFSKVNNYQLISFSWQL